MTQTSADHTLQFTEPISPPTATEASNTPPLLERQGSVSKIAHIAKKMVQSPPSTPNAESTNSSSGRAMEETINSVKTGEPTDVHRMEA